MLCLPVTEMLPDYTERLVPLATTDVTYSVAKLES